MARQQRLSDLFVSQLDKFTMAIRKSFPGSSKELNKIEFKLRMVKKYDSKIIVQNFHDHLVKKYRTEIANRDERFFLDFDLSCTVLKDLDILKEIWKSASDGSKVAIWKYIDQFVKISEAFINN